MKNLLLHEKSQTKWIFVNEYKPQFSNVSFVNLQNIETGKTQSFNASTYQLFFKPII